MQRLSLGRRSKRVFMKRCRPVGSALAIVTFTVLQ